MGSDFDFLVIIPTYKRQDPLHAAIESALSQSGVTMKLIVADDCPDGSAKEIVKQFPDVIYLKNPSPSGGWPGRVRNFAFSRSREMRINARFVHFLDDDDTVSEGHYAIVKETFDRYPRIGVVFGILRPFCRFSDDPDRRKRQELQLKNVRNWRIEVARFPWIYHQISTTLKLPFVARWLYSLHAVFGPEMFLCSSGAIRYEHFLEIGGFPDIRITEDYIFFTKAIRRLGVRFLTREAAGYGVGDSNALWNPLDLSGPAKMAHAKEFLQGLRLRQQAFQAEMGHFRYRALKRVFIIEKAILDRFVIPALDRRGYFEDLYRLTDPDRRTEHGTPRVSP